MFSRNIRLDSIEEAVDFVNEISKCPYGVELSKDGCTVNAKSILGVLSLGIGETVRMDINADEMICNRK